MLVYTNQLSAPPTPSLFLQSRQGLENCRSAPSLHLPPNLLKSPITVCYPIKKKKLEIFHR